MPFRYILSRVWVWLCIFSRFYIMQYTGLCVFNLPISLVMIEIIHILRIMSQSPRLVCAIRVKIYCVILLHTVSVIYIYIYIYIGRAKNGATDPLGDTSIYSQSSVAGTTNISMKRVFCGNFTCKPSVVITNGLLASSRTEVRFTKACDVTIQSYRKSQTRICVRKMHILLCLGSKFQRCPMKFHTKFWMHTSQNMHLMRCWKSDELWYLRDMTS